MNKTANTKRKIISEVKPPGFGESLNEIFSITGKNTDFSTYSKPQGKDRLLKDKTGVFKEMDDKKKGETIAE
ncbi:hypothetical protein A3D03_02760 [Candidatus Gottesmanbacteria bacterium RIFCSPHIGHO2_02_FULL_40_13]|uniref:Uncharacterized protein n=1 Tax=Candidatus Gottesmanbacteria bacterium RIFCSPHIGHO2_02_FULL_40_13 TaxID=1798384 RepID=A0A1F6A5G8_9BACT|nr:MAG: hypothetical protein A3D03_02760 [Candidatus Gottesmanbacteria bacterium RIFCSPHIGHO2_02_FULL_40_13]